MELVAGAMIGTEVRLLRALEEGGMGAVWVGEHIASKTEVAVKFVHKDLARRDPSVIERFDREAAVLDSIQSPHVVRIFTKGKLPDGTPYIVMELMKGESLVKRLERTGKWMSVEEVGTLLSQIAEALEPVHAQNMVHRDLKGENIFLIDPPERIHVKVLDFGLAKTAVAPGKAKLTAAGAMLGSAEFMSPEQIVSAMSVDRKADLWAVAALAYMALTLALPFHSEKLSMVLTAIRSGIFTLPSELRRELPPSVDQWFRKAFQLDARRRFESARQMSDAWQQAIGKAAPESASLLDIQASGLFMPPQMPGARGSNPGASGVYAPPGLATPAAGSAGASGVYAPPGSAVPGARPSGAGASGSFVPLPSAGSSGQFPPAGGAGASGSYAPLPSAGSSGQFPPRGAGASGSFVPQPSAGGSGQFPPANPAAAPDYVEAPNPFAKPAAPVAPAIAPPPASLDLDMPKPRSKLPIVIGIAVALVVAIVIVVVAGK